MHNSVLCIYILYNISLTINDKFYLPIPKSRVFFVKIKIFYWKLYFGHALNLRWVHFQNKLQFYENLLLQGLLTFSVIRVPLAESNIKKYFILTWSFITIHRIQTVFPNNNPIYKWKIFGSYFFFNLSIKAPVC